MDWKDVTNKNAALVRRVGEYLFVHGVILFYLYSSSLLDEHFSFATSETRPVGIQALCWGVSRMNQ